MENYCEQTKHFPNIIKLECHRIIEMHRFYLGRKIMSVRPAHSGRSDIVRPMNINVHRRLRIVRACCDHIAK